MMTFEEKIRKIREYAAAYLERAERERCFGDREKAAVLLKDGRRLKLWADRMEYLLRTPSQNCCFVNFEYLTCKKPEFSAKVKL
ncbi:MAG: hypothetical protein R2941_20795 [Desulfobacterales bacterium]